MINAEALRHFEEQVCKHCCEWDKSLRHCNTCPTDTAKKALEKQATSEWIPVSERLPEELVSVNVTWVNRKPTSYYEHIKDKPFTATAMYCNEKWFWWSSICEDILAEYGRNDAEMVDEYVEILAWQPLPEPWKGEVNE